MTHSQDSRELRGLPLVFCFNNSAGPQFSYPQLSTFLAPEQSEVAALNWRICRADNERCPHLNQLQ